MVWRACHVHHLARSPTVAATTRTGHLRVFVAGRLPARLREPWATSTIQPSSHVIHLHPSLQFMLRGFGEDKMPYRGQGHAFSPRPAHSHGGKSAAPFGP